MPIWTRQNRRYSLMGWPSGGLFLGLVVLLSPWWLGGEASAADPDWVKQGKDVELEGLGVLQAFAFVNATGDPAADLQSAVEQARSELAKQLRVKVEGTTVDLWNEKGKGRSRPETLSDLRSEVRTSVDLTLEGVGIRKFPEEARKAKKYYALAFLNPEHAARKIEEKLRPLYAEIRERKARAGEAMNAWKVREALVHLTRARWAALQADGHAANYLVLRRDGNPPLGDVRGCSEAELDVDGPWAELLHGLKLEPTSKEKIPVVEGQPPKDPLVACLTFRRGDRAAGVAGLPVRFGLLNAEGVLQAGVPVRTRGMQGTRSAVSSDASATVQSDADGLVTCQVLALKGGNEKVQTVSAGMDVDALFQELGEVDQDQVRRWLSPLRELKAVFVLESAEDVKLSLADWTDRRVRRLTEQTGWPKDAKVLIGAFTYRDTKAAGEFGRALTRLFATALGKAGVGVVRNDPQRTAPILRGEYWDDEKLIDIRVQLEDQSGRQLVATAACLSRPEAGSYALTPEKEQLAKFQETAESLSDPKIRVQKDFSIQIWTDRGTAPFYEEGEKMTVFLRPTKECFVRLLYITADRKTLLIYPNDWGTSDRLEAGKVYQIPGKQDRFDFEISGPFGPEILKVIAATERMPVPKGEKISGAILLADAAPENLACLFRGITVKKRVEESSEAPAARWDAEAEVVVNTGPR